MNRSLALIGYFGLAVLSQATLADEAPPAATQATSSNTSAEAKATPAASDAEVRAEAEKKELADYKYMLSRGYKAQEVHKDGDRVYCKTVTFAGSNIPQKQCMTAREYYLMMDSSQNSVRSIQNSAYMLHNK